MSMFGEDMIDDDLLSTNGFQTPIHNESQRVPESMKRQFRDNYSLLQKNEEMRRMRNSNRIELLEDANDIATFTPAPVSATSEKKTEIEPVKTIINVQSKNRDKKRWKYPNEYEIPFKKGFKNIKSIELRSTEIPNTEQTIREYPSNLQNNLIRWQNKEDKYGVIYCMYPLYKYTATKSILMECFVQSRNYSDYRDRFTDLTNPAPTRLMIKNCVLKLPSSNSSVELNKISKNGEYYDVFFKSYLYTGCNTLQIIIPLTDSAWTQYSSDIDTVYELQPSMITYLTDKETYIFNRIALTGGDSLLLSNLDAEGYGRYNQTTIRETNVSTYGEIYEIDLVINDFERRTYTTKVTPGNYLAETIVPEMETMMNIQTVNDDLNEFAVSMNIENDTTVVSSFRDLEFREGSILMVKTNEDYISQDFSRYMKTITNFMIIRCLSHGLLQGDKIKISDFNSGQYGISRNFINDYHYIYFLTAKKEDSTVYVSLCENEGGFEIPLIDISTFDSGDIRTPLNENYFLIRTDGYYPNGDYGIPMTEYYTITNSNNTLVFTMYSTPVKYTLLLDEGKYTGEEIASALTLKMSSLTGLDIVVEYDNVTRKFTFKMTNTTINSPHKIIFHFEESTLTKILGFSVSPYILNSTNTIKSDNNVTLLNITSSNNVMIILKTTASGETIEEYTVYLTTGTYNVEEFQTELENRVLEETDYIINVRYDYSTNKFIFSSGSIFNENVLIFSFLPDTTSTVLLGYPLEYVLTDTQNVESIKPVKPFYVNYSSNIPFEDTRELSLTKIRSKNNVYKVYITNGTYTSYDLFASVLKSNTLITTGITVDYSIIPPPPNFFGTTYSFILRTEGKTLKLRFDKSTISSTLGFTTQQFTLEYNQFSGEFIDTFKLEVPIIINTTNNMIYIEEPVSLTDNYTVSVLNGGYTYNELGSSLIENIETETDVRLSYNYDVSTNKYTFSKVSSTDTGDVIMKFSDSTLNNDIGFAQRFILSSDASFSSVITTIGKISVSRSRDYLRMSKEVYDYTILPFGQYVVTNEYVLEIDSGIYTIDEFGAAISLTILNNTGLAVNVVFNETTMNYVFTTTGTGYRLVFDFRDDNSLGYYLNMTTIYRLTNDLINYGDVYIPPTPSFHSEAAINGQLTVNSKNNTLNVVLNSTKQEYNIVVPGGTYSFNGFADDIQNRILSDVGYNVTIAYNFSTKKFVFSTLETTTELIFDFGNSTISELLGFPREYVLTSDKSIVSVSELSNKVVINSDNKTINIYKNNVKYVVTLTEFEYAYSELAREMTTKMTNTNYKITVEYDIANKRFIISTLMNDFVEIEFTGTLSETLGFPLSYKLNSLNSIESPNEIEGKIFISSSNNKLKAVKYDYFSYESEYLITFNDGEYTLASFATELATKISTSSGMAINVLYDDLLDVYKFSTTTIKKQLELKFTDPLSTVSSVFEGTTSNPIITKDESSKIVSNFTSTNEVNILRKVYITNLNNTLTIYKTDGITTSTRYDIIALNGFYGPSDFAEYLSELITTISNIKISITYDEVQNKFTITANPTEITKVLIDFINSPMTELLGFARDINYILYNFDYKSQNVSNIIESENNVITIQIAGHPNNVIQPTEIDNVFGLVRHNAGAILTSGSYSLEDFANELKFQLNQSYGVIVSPEGDQPGVYEDVFDVKVSENTVTIEMIKVTSKTYNFSTGYPMPIEIRGTLYNPNYLLPDTVVDEITAPNELVADYYIILNNVFGNNWVGLSLYNENRNIIQQTTVSIPNGSYGASNICQRILNGISTFSPPMDVSVTFNETTKIFEFGLNDPTEKRMLEFTFYNLFTSNYIGNKIGFPEDRKYNYILKNNLTDSNIAESNVSVDGIVTYNFTSDNNVLIIRDITNIENVVTKTIEIPIGKYSGSNLSVQTTTFIQNSGVNDITVTYNSQRKFTFTLSPNSTNKYYIDFINSTASELFGFDSDVFVMNSVDEYDVYKQIAFLSDSNAITESKLKVTNTNSTITFYEINSNGAQIFDTYNIPLITGDYSSNELMEMVNNVLKSYKPAGYRDNLGTITLTYDSMSDLYSFSISATESRKFVYEPTSSFSLLIGIVSNSDKYILNGKNDYDNMMTSRFTSPNQIQTQTSGEIVVSSDSTLTIKILNNDLSVDATYDILIPSGTFNGLNWANQIQLLIMNTSFDNVRITVAFDIIEQTMTFSVNSIETSKYYIDFVNWSAASTFGFTNNVILTGNPDDIPQPILSFESMFEVNEPLNASGMLEIYIRAYNNIDGSLVSEQLHSYGMMSMPGMPPFIINSATELANAVINIVKNNIYRTTVSPNIKLDFPTFNVVYSPITKKYTFSIGEEPEPHRLEFDFQRSTMGQYLGFPVVQSTPLPPGYIINPDAPIETLRSGLPSGTVPINIYYELESEFTVFLPEVPPDQYFEYLVSTDGSSYEYKKITLTETLSNADFALYVTNYVRTNDGVSTFLLNYDATKEKYKFTMGDNETTKFIFGFNTVVNGYPLNMSNMNPGIGNYIGFMFGKYYFFSRTTYLSNIESKFVSVYKVNPTNMLQTIDATNNQFDFYIINNLIYSPKYSVTLFDGNPGEYAPSEIASELNTIVNALIGNKITIRYDTVLSQYVFENFTGDDTFKIDTISSSTAGIFSYKYNVYISNTIKGVATSNKIEYIAYIELNPSNNTFVIFNSLSNVSHTIFFDIGFYDPVYFAGVIKTKIIDVLPELNSLLDVQYDSSTTKYIFQFGSNPSLIPIIFKFNESSIANILGYIQNSTTYNYVLIPQNFVANNVSVIYTTKISSDDTIENVTYVIDNSNNTLNLNIIDLYQPQQTPYFVTIPNGTYTPTNLANVIQTNLFDATGINVNVTYSESLKKYEITLATNEYFYFDFIISPINLTLGIRANRRYVLCNLAVSMFSSTLNPSYTTLFIIDDLNNDIIINGQTISIPVGSYDSNEFVDTLRNNIKGSILNSDLTIEYLQLSNKLIFTAIKMPMLDFNFEDSSMSSLIGFTSTGRIKLVPESDIKYSYKMLIESDAIIPTKITIDNTNRLLRTYVITDQGVLSLNNIELNVGIDRFSTDIAAELTNKINGLGVLANVTYDSLNSKYNISLNASENKLFAIDVLNSTISSVLGMNNNRRYVLSSEIVSAKQSPFKTLYNLEFDLNGTNNELYFGNFMTKSTITVVPVGIYTGTELAAVITTALQTNIHSSFQITYNDSIEFNEKFIITWAYDAVPSQFDHYFYFSDLISTISSLIGFNQNVQIVTVPYTPRYSFAFSSNLVNSDDVEITNGNNSIIIDYFSNIGSNFFVTVYIPPGIYTKTELGNTLKQLILQQTGLSINITYDSSIGKYKFEMEYLQYGNVEFYENSDSVILKNYFGFQTRIGLSSQYVSEFQSVNSIEKTVNIQYSNASLLFYYYNQFNQKIERSVFLNSGTYYIDDFITLLRNSINQQLQAGINDIQLTYDPVINKIKFSYVESQGLWFDFINSTMSNTIGFSNTKNYYFLANERIYLLTNSFVSESTISGSVTITSNNNSLKAAFIKDRFSYEERYIIIPDGDYSQISIANIIKTEINSIISTIYPQVGSMVGSMDTGITVNVTYENNKFKFEISKEEYSQDFDVFIDFRNSSMANVLGFENASRNNKRLSTQAFSIITCSITPSDTIFINGNNNLLNVQKKDNDITTNYPVEIENGSYSIISLNNSIQSNLSEIGINVNITNDYITGKSKFTIVNNNDQGLYLFNFIDSTISQYIGFNGDKNYTLTGSNNLRRISVSISSDLTVNSVILFKYFYDYNLNITNLTTNVYYSISIVPTLIPDDTEYTPSQIVTVINQRISDFSNGQFRVGVSYSGGKYTFSLTQVNSDKYLIEFTDGSKEVLGFSNSILLYYYAVDSKTSSVSPSLYYTLMIPNSQNSLKLNKRVDSDIGTRYDVIIPSSDYEVSELETVIINTIHAETGVIVGVEIDPLTKKITFSAASTNSILLFDFDGSTIATTFGFVSSDYYILKTTSTTITPNPNTTTMFLSGEIYGSIQITNDTNTLTVVKLSNYNETIITIPNGTYSLKTINDTIGSIVRNSLSYAIVFNYINGDKKINISTTETDSFGVLLDFSRSTVSQTIGFNRYITVSYNIPAISYSDLISKILITSLNNKLRFERRQNSSIDYNITIDSGSYKKDDLGLELMTQIYKTTNVRVVIEFDEQSSRYRIYTSESGLEIYFNWIYSSISSLIGFQGVSKLTSKNILNSQIINNENIVVNGLNNIINVTIKYIEITEYEINVTQGYYEYSELARIMRIALFDVSKTDVVIVYDPNTLTYEFIKDTFIESLQFNIRDSGIRDYLGFPLSLTLSQTSEILSFSEIKTIKMIRRPTDGNGYYNADFYVTKYSDLSGTTYLTTRNYYFELDEGEYTYQEFADMLKTKIFTETGFVINIQYVAATRKYTFTTTMRNAALKFDFFFSAQQSSVTIRSVLGFNLNAVYTITRDISSLITVTTFTSQNVLSSIIEVNDTNNTLNIDGAGVFVSINPDIYTMENLASTINTQINNENPNIYFEYNPLTRKVRYYVTDGGTYKIDFSDVSLNDLFGFNELYNKTITSTNSITSHQNIVSLIDLRYIINPNLTLQLGNPPSVSVDINLGSTINTNETLATSLTMVMDFMGFDIDVLYLSNKYRFILNTLGQYIRIDVFASSPQLIEILGLSLKDILTSKISFTSPNSSIYKKTITSTNNELIIKNNQTLAEYNITVPAGEYTSVGLASTLQTLISSAVGASVNVNYNFQDDKYVFTTGAPNNFTFNVSTSSIAEILGFKVYYITTNNYLTSPYEINEGSLSVGLMLFNIETNDLLTLNSGVGDSDVLLKATRDFRFMFKEFNTIANKIGYENINGWDRITRDIEEIADYRYDTYYVYKNEQQLTIGIRLMIKNHNYKENDIIRITQTNSKPFIDGLYKISVLDKDHVLISPNKNSTNPFFDNIYLKYGGSITPFFYNDTFSQNPQMYLKREESNGYANVALIKEIRQTSVISSSQTLDSVYNDPLSPLFELKNSLPQYIYFITDSDLSIFNSTNVYIYSEDYVIQGWNTILNQLSNIDLTIEYSLNSTGEYNPTVVSVDGGTNNAIRITIFDDLDHPSNISKPTIKAYYDYLIEYLTNDDLSKGVYIYSPSTGYVLYNGSVQLLAENGNAGLINANPVTVISQGPNSMTLNIKHYNHSLAKYDKVFISGFENDKFKFLDSYSGDYEVIEVPDKDNFVIEVPYVFPTKDLNHLIISSKYTGFRPEQDNLDAYGKVQGLISLDGDRYIYMVNDKFDAIDTTGNQDKILAKINLTNAPGSILYNTHVTNPIVFEEAPYNYLDKLKIKFVRPDGTLFDFNQEEHSFTLEIVEHVDKVANTGVSSRRGMNDSTTRVNN